MSTIRTNADGSLPLKRDAMDRPYLDPATVAEIAALGGGAGAHPDLATHDALGLATDAELTAHAGNATAHGSFAASGHTHAYAAPSHSHAESDVTSLTTDLAGKASSSHNHDASYSATGHTHSLAAAWPVGAVFLSVLSTNPATLLGFGTWSQVAGGLYLVGQTGVQTGGQQIGSSTHAHTFTQPGAHSNHVFTQPTAAGEAAHTHSFTASVNAASPKLMTTNTSSGAAASGTTGAGSSHTHSMSGGAVDAHSAHSGGAVANGTTDPPGFVVYVWQRTA